MTKIPKIKFTKKTVTISEDDFNKVLEDHEKGGGGKFLDVGEYTVEIKNAQFSKNKETGEITCKNDPTWLNVRVDFTVGDKAKPYWVQVPTSRIEFNPENSKKPLFVFIKFREFMSALGETVLASPESLQEIVPKYFEDPSKLNGKKLKIKIDYTGIHLKFINKEAYKIVNRDGSDHDIFDKIYTSRDEAKAAAAEAKVELQFFPEVVKLIEADNKPKKEKPQPEKEVEVEQEIDNDWD